MPIVEIDGVGRVELDDSFSRMSPDQQEATINEIVSSARKAPQSAPAPQQGPTPEVPSDGQPLPFAPPPAEPPKHGGTSFDFDKLEAEYQAQQKDQNRTYVDAPKAEKTSTLGALGLGAADGLSFGFDDEIGSAIGAVIPGLGKKSMWDKDSSFKDAFNSNVDAYRNEKDAAFEEHPLAYIGGGLASALVPFGAAGKLVSGGKGIISAAREAEALGTASNASRFAKGAKNGAIAGGLYGAGSDEGGVTDRLDGAVKGALTGAGAGVAGEAVIGTALRALPGAKASRFAEREAERNPYAAFDAEVVQDLAAATRDRAVTAHDPKGRAVLTAKTINSVEQRYFAEFKNIVNAMDDISVPEKLRLKSALTAKYALGTDEINALRGTVQGDAVADAIVKVQRLRALTPELKRSNGLLAKVGGLADWVPGIPPAVGNTIRKVGRAVGEGEAARVNAAERLLAKERGYNKLADMVGPSGQKESSQALWGKLEGQLASQAEEEALAKAAKEKKSAMDATIRAEKPEVAAYKQDRRANVKLMNEADPELQRRADLLKEFDKTIKGQDKALGKFDDALNAPIPEPAAPKDPTQRERAAFRKSLEPDGQDLTALVERVDGERQLAAQARSRKAALSKAEALNSKSDNALADWEAKLADPTTAPPTKEPKAPKVNAKDSVVDDNIAQGIAGDSGTHNAFTSRVEVSKDDLMRILDKAEEDFPDLAPELNRIRFNYPTKDRTLGSAIVPRLKAIRDDLGIAPAKTEAKVAETVPVDEAAQARLAGSPDAPKLTAKQLVREQEITQRLDEIDPVRMTLADGIPSRDSDLGMLTDPAAVAEATKLKEELRTIRQIDRPQQWSEGKNRYQTLANGAIDDLNGDIRIGSEAMSALKRIPEKIRDSFKTTDDATAYIENDVIPELEANKVPGDEIDLIRGYLYEVASHKPYASKEAYEAGTKANPRGRPRKN